MYVPSSGIVIEPLTHVNNSSSYAN